MTIINKHKRYCTSSSEPDLKYNTYNLYHVIIITCSTVHRFLVYKVMCVLFTDCAVITNYKFCVSIININGCICDRCVGQSHSARVVKT